MLKIFRIRVTIGYYEDSIILDNNSSFESFYEGEEKTSRFMVDNNFLEGYISLDYIVGWIVKDTLTISICTEAGEIMEFEAPLKNYKISGDGYLFLFSVEEDNMYCSIFFKEMEKTPLLLEETYKNTSNAKKVAEFPEATVNEKKYIFILTQ